MQQEKGFLTLELVNISTPHHFISINMKVFSTSSIISVSIYSPTSAPFISTPLPLPHITSSLFPCRSPLLPHLYPFTSIPSSPPLYFHAGFLYFWGIVFLVTTTLVAIFKKEKPDVQNGFYYYPYVDYAI